MKFLLAACLLVAWMQVTCQVLSVDNNPTPMGGAYTTLQSAYDAAVSGDTLYIIPSSTSYGDLNIAKPITIFGGGFYPDTDTKYTSEVGALNINAGASNLLLSGLKIGDLRLAYEAVTFSLNTIRVTHCNIDQVGVAESGSNIRSIDSLVFINNVFGNTGGGNITGGYVDLVKSGNDVSKTYFYNNIFVGSTGTAGTVSADTAYFYNNLFFGQSATGGSTAFAETNSNIFRNNIFFGRAPSATTTLTNNTFNFNLSSDSTFSAIIGVSGNSGGSNFNYTDPAFVQVITGTTYDFTFDLSIAVGSPAKDSGSDGTDLGPAGGLYPFDPTGTPLPVITGVTLPSIVVQGNDISISISGKGN